MKNKWKITDALLDSLELIKGEALPVSWVDAVNVADAACKEVNAQVSNLCALLRISKLALSGNAVLGAADAADLSLNRNTLCVSCLYDLFGALKVGLKIRLVRTIVHNGSKSSLDALERILV